MRTQRIVRRTAAARKSTPQRGQTAESSAAMVVLTGRNVIAKFVRKHRDAQGGLAEWTRAVERADWGSIDDVRRLYPATDGGVRTNRGKLVTVFNVKGNEYRLIADIVYPARIVTVLELMSHADYSKNLWKNRSYP